MKITDQSEDRLVAEQRERDKALGRRRLAEAHWTQRDLLEIFGLCMVHRLNTVTNPQSGNIGKNHFSKHFHAGARNPAGSKLMRRFIRAKGTWSSLYEAPYKALTGRRYDHLNLGEEDAEAVA